MSQIYVGIIPGVLYEQEGTTFQTTQWGFDHGVRRWLTHPGTSQNAYPQRNQRDSLYTSMYVTDVIPRQDASGLIEIVATYKGLKTFYGGIAKERVIPGADAQMMSIGVLDSGKRRTLLAQIPKDSCTREYVTTGRPDLGGVGANYNGGFFPGVTPFQITFVADPSADPPPKNYRTGWILDSRSWEDVADSVFLVRERFSFYNTIGS